MKRFVQLSCFEIIYDIINEACGYDIYSDGLLNTVTQIIQTL